MSSKPALRQESKARVIIDDTYYKGMSREEVATALADLACKLKNIVSSTSM